MAVEEGIRTESVLMDLDDIHFDPDHMSKHGNAHMQRLTGTIMEYGQLKPLIYNRRFDCLIDGHARVEALHAAGRTQARVEIVDLPWEEHVALAFALHSTYRTWNRDMVKILLERLERSGFDLDLTGLAPGQIDRFLGRAETTPREKKVSCPSCGQTFEVGH